jgi:hypothetical protein
MKRIRLLLVAALFGFVATACSSDLVGPNPTEPSFDGQGMFGSGG